MDYTYYSVLYGEFENNNNKGQKNCFQSSDLKPGFSKIRAHNLNYWRWWDQIQARKLKIFDFSNYKVFGWFYIGPLYNVHLLSPTVWLLTTVLLGVDRAEVSSLKIWWNGSRRGNREFKGFHHLPSTMRPKYLWNQLEMYIFHHVKGQLI